MKRVDASNKAGAVSLEFERGKWTGGKMNEKIRFASKAIKRFDALIENTRRDGENIAGSAMNTGYNTTKMQGIRIHLPTSQLLQYITCM